MKIVALGDSLTVGNQTIFDMTNFGESASYPTYLEGLALKHLRAHQSDVKFNIVNKGVCGDLTSGMLERFARDVVVEKPNCVIILGGTNDIGWGLEPAVIVRNLEMMYDAALSENILPIPCSIPSILGFDELISPRLRLNGIIHAKAEERRLAYVDLFAATADPRTQRLLRQYSADGLHLNDAGYERVAECIFDGWLKAFLDSEVKST
jgi:lysophospholipase L1-like esterase